MTEPPDLLPLSVTEEITRPLPFGEGGLDFAQSLAAFKAWFKHATDQFIHTHLLTNPDDYHVESEHDHDQL